MKHDVLKIGYTKALNGLKECLDTNKRAYIILDGEVYIVALDKEQ